MQTCRRLHSALFRQTYIRFISFRKLTSQNGSSQVKASWTSFDLTKQNLAIAEKKFETLGPRAVLQGSAVKLEDVPKLKLPEVAFVGRTSVGKSSLINALVHQKKLVRTSKKPGHTRLLNFFNVGSKFYLVDLPGYGYVQGLGSQRGSEYFIKVAENYLKERAGKELRSVCLLIDGKVGVTEKDLIAFEMMEEFGVPFQVVLTKMDKVPQHRHQLMLDEVQRIKDSRANICFPHTFSVSAKEKTGLSELRYCIALCVGLIK